MTVAVKGTGFKASVGYMREMCDHAQWHELLLRFEPDEREAIEDLHIAERYSVELADKLYRGYASVKCCDEYEKCRVEFSAVGRHIAEVDLVGVYKIMISVMSPAMVARFLPAQWQLYFPGVEVEVEELDLKNKRVVNVVRGLGGFAYISPTAASWIRFAFEKVGARDVVVWESSFDSGEVASDELRYVIGWS